MADSFFLEAHRLAQNMEPAPAAPRGRPIFAAPEGMTRCACNKKNISFEEIQIHNSPFVRGITDSICKECLAYCRKHAMVVCIRCKSVVSRISPQRYRSGFVLAPGSIVHTNGCPECVKGVIVTCLIEKAMFDHANGYAVKPEIITALKLKRK